MLCVFWPSLFVSLVMVLAIDLLLDFCNFSMLKASCIKHWETWYTQSLSAQNYKVLFWKNHPALPFLNPFDTWKLTMWPFHMAKDQLDFFLCIFRMLPRLNSSVIENYTNKTWKAQYSLVVTPVKWSHCLLLSSVKTILKRTWRWFFQN